jgi:hypothetical protein
MTKRLARIRLMVLVGLLGVGVLSFFILQPALRARKVLRLLAAVQVGKTSTADFRRMASSYGVDLIETAETFDLSQRNGILKTLHFAPSTVIMMNAKATNGVVNVVSVRAWIGDSLEFAKINIDELDSHNTSCGDVPICVQRTSSTMTTHVFFVPSTPQDQRERFFSLNTWCLAKLGGCKSSREFFPIAWDSQYAPISTGAVK